MFVLGVECRAPGQDSRMRVDGTLECSECPLVPVWVCECHVPQARCSKAFAVAGGVGGLYGGRAICRVGELARRGELPLAREGYAACTRRILRLPRCASIAQIVKTFVTEGRPGVAGVTPVTRERNHAALRVAAESLRRAVQEIIERRSAGGELANVGLE